MYQQECIPAKYFKDVHPCSLFCFDRSALEATLPTVHLQLSLMLVGYSLLHDPLREPLPAIPRMVGPIYQHRLQVQLGTFC